MIWRQRWWLCVLGKGLKVLLMKALGWVFKRLSLGREVRRGVALFFEEFHLFLLFYLFILSKSQL